MANKNRTPEHQDSEGVPSCKTRGDVLTTRIGLEKITFVKVMHSLTETTLENLEVLMRRMYRSASDRDIPRLVKDDIDFHEEIVALAMDESCSRSWRDIRPTVLQKLQQSIDNAESLHGVVDRHRRLLVALRYGDQNAMERTIEAHIRH